MSYTTRLYYGRRKIRLMHFGDVVGLDYLSLWG